MTAGSAGDTATELTAVPIRTARPEGRLAPAALGGMFTAGGRPLAVDAVERGKADVFVVRAPGFEKKVPFRDPTSMVPRKRYGLFPPGRRIRFRLVSISPVRFPTPRGTSEVFGITPGVQPEELADLLLARRTPGELAGRPQLADAVATAGLEALARQVPRAVVLVIGGGPAADASVLDPAAVRRYLEAIGVPLFVWSLDGRRSAGGWGEVEDISTPWGLRDAYGRLAREVDRQQIVWLEGRHLPQSIALAPAARAKGIERVAGAGR